MRYYILILILFFVAIPSVTAKEPAPYAPFVNDSTLAIIKIEPTKLDVKKAVELSQMFVPEGIPEEIILKMHKWRDAVSAITGKKTALYYYLGQSLRSDGPRRVALL